MEVRRTTDGTIGEWLRVGALILGIVVALAATLYFTPAMAQQVSSCMDGRLRQRLCVAAKSWHQQYLSFSPSWPHSGSL